MQSKYQSQNDKYKNGHVPARGENNENIQTINQSTV
jgi:hypothetical protein